MASDYRPLASERELEQSSPNELDFMYDKATLDQAAIFIEDAIKVSHSREGHSKELEWLSIVDTG